MKFVRQTDGGHKRTSAFLSRVPDPRLSFVFESLIYPLAACKPLYVPASQRAAGT